ncbi:unnamed protein product [Amoebophrya sp. A25]|nr:unnamed protein product [Amoebophrya sp. A25]|eukprot:GSA25T00010563001.1
MASMAAAANFAGGRRLKLSHYIKPLLPYIPDIAPPDRKILFQEKALYTILTLLCFLVASQIPLYGILGGNKNDPFYWMRAILAANRGSLMELGIAPIVTTSTVLQFLAGSRIVDVDQNLKEDRVVYEAAQKVCGVGFTFIQALCFVSSGMYGDPAELGGPICMALVAQLTFMGFVVVYLDELLQKGWGIGSGISLFITASICETIMWKAFSLKSITTPNGSVYEGAITSFFHQLLWSNNKLSALTEAVYRPYGANLTNIIATVVVFVIVVYFQGFRVDLAVKSQRVRGQTGSYPIRVFYTSNMPIILHSALVSNVYFFSQLVFKRFRNNFLVNMLGQWQEVDYVGEKIPVGGLAYYLSPPTGLLDFLLDPFRSVVYCSLVIVSCAVLSNLWIDISGEAPRDVAKRLRMQQLVFVGHRSEALEPVLRKYIPPAARLGGALIAVLTILADLVGCVGSGTGMLLAVNMTYQYVEQIAKEQGVPSMF